MEYVYTLNLNISDREQKNFLLQSFAPLAGELDEFDIECFHDDLLDFIDSDDLCGNFDLPLPLCDEILYTEIITDCMVILAKALPEHAFETAFCVINCSSDGNRLVEYSYDKKNLSVNILDTDSAIICECEACEKELDGSIYLDSYFIGEEKNCHYCGVELSFGNEKLTNLVITPENHTIEPYDDDIWNLADEDFDDDDE